MTGGRADGPADGAVRGPAPGGGEGGDGVEAEARAEGAGGADLRCGPILLSPGPVNLSHRVRRALLSPDLCHREEEFAGLQEEIRRRLLAVYGLAPERWTAVLFSGSGTAAVEAMVGGLVPREGRLLVVENGAYGERISRIAAAHGIPSVALRLEWGAPVPVESLEAMLEEERRVTHVAVVHHETTTGRLNDLAAIAAACEAGGAGLLVDGVSSFGGEELDFDGWGLEACAASANKCLHGVPGVALVVARREALSSLPAAPRSVYLDLGAYARAQDRRDTPFTPAVQGFQALAEALRELEDEGGWRARRERYARLAELVEEGLGRLGIRPHLPREGSSVVLRAYRLPAGMEYGEFHDGLKARGFIIYAGQGGLARRIFRVSTMGALSEAEVRAFVAAVEEVIRRR